MNATTRTMLIVTALAATLAHCSGSQSTTSNNTLANNNPPTEDAASAVADDAMTVAPVEQDSSAATVEAVDAAASAPVVVDASASPDAGADAAHATQATHTSTPTRGTNTTASSSTAASGAVAEGRAVFDRTCGRCHGASARRIGPSLNGRNDSEAHTRQVVRNGDGTMRPIPVARLSDADLAKVLTYLRSIHAVR